jgi:lipopolysaccharide export system protein LptA
MSCTSVCRSAARLLAALLISVWVLPAIALPDDPKQPIEIEADGVEMDDGKQTSVYTGNVEIQQGSMRLWADKVTVHHQASRSPHRLIAIGQPARYEQQLEAGAKKVKARARRIEYDANSEEILLIDNASLTQGKDKFSSDRILYDRSKAVVKGGASAQGKQRVRISIDPSNK